MITERDYNKISDDVYKVDSRKVKRPYQTGQEVADGKYVIINAKENVDNGMQAMAVAPIMGYDEKKTPIPNYSEVVIAYAGTNSENIADLVTDGKMIGLGDTEAYGFHPNRMMIPAQSATALDFAKQVEKEVKRKNANAVITTTGHSLGQSLAMYVGLKQGYANVGYNGPDIHKMISDKEIKYMQEHPEQFRNYRNKHDDIGNVMGNVTKTAIYPKVTKGKDNIKNNISDHSLTNWQFTKDGQLKDLDGKVVTDKVVSAYAQTIAVMARITAKSEQLAKGGYSSREQIFLDTVQGAAVAQGMAAAAQAGADDIEQVVKEGVEKAKSLWEAIDFTAYQELSYDEVVSLFASQGATYESIVTETQTTLEVGQTNAGTKAEAFTTLKGQVDQVIQANIATDKNLAKDIENWTR
ncbi:triacylglycerol lipase [Streptococcus pluranimalium]